MHTKELLCRSPAAIVSLRPVTLRPYLSVSLPSGCRIFQSSDTVKTSWYKRLISRMSGYFDNPSLYNRQANIGLRINYRLFSIGNEYIGLKVITKGVETEAQKEFLELRGCLAFQGHLLGEAIPAELFEAVLRKNSSIDTS